MYCIFINLVFLLTFYTWASGSDDRSNPIPRIDVNKLIDWLTERENAVATDQRVSRSGPWERLALTQKMLGRVFLFPFPMIPSAEPKSFQSL